MYEITWSNSNFIKVHVWCFLANIMASLLSKYNHYEIAKILEVSKVPFFVWVIYEAHYYELN
jgi:hypothetical protein